MSDPQLYFQLPVGLTDEMIWPDYPVESLASLNAGLAAALASEPENGGGAVTRFVGYKLLGNPRATRQQAIAALPLMPGDPSPFFDPVDDISRDPKASLLRSYDSPLDMATCGPTARPDWQTISRLALLALAGGRAYWIKEENAMPVYFVLNSLDEICPFGDGVETWATWGTFGQSHHPVQLGGTWYRSSAYGEWGRNIEIDQWIPLYLSGQLSVISVEQFQAIQQQFQPGPI